MTEFTHNQLFNKADAALVEDITIELLQREIRANVGAPFKDCVIPFKFNGQDYDADYWQEITPEHSAHIWCCEVTKFDINMNMRDYDTEFMWSDYVDNIGE